MDIKKIYANEHGKGTIVCDQCGKVRMLDVVQFGNLNKPLKVRCGCGHVFLISVEVRKFYRKPTHLAGEYIVIRNNHAKEIEKGRMTVEDLSRTGIGFRTSAPHNIHVLDVVRIRFLLDDVKQSEINKSAIARRVANYFIGAEFTDFDAYSDTNRTLGFYLMPR